MAMLFLFVFCFKLVSPIFLLFQLAHPWAVTILSENSVNAWLLYDLSISFFEDFGVWIIFCYLSQLFSPIHLFWLFFLGFLTWRRRWRWWRSTLWFLLMLGNLLNDFLLYLCLLLHLSHYFLLLCLNFWRTFFLLYLLFDLFFWFLFYLRNFFFNYDFYRLLN